MDLNGNLRRSVFNNAVLHLKGDSSPGYPFSHIDRNDKVDPLELYEFVNETLKIWINFDLTIYSDFDRVALCELALQCGFAWPTTLFVKGEPTKQEKVARLIYGVSIVMNIIGRILFGDYLGHVKTTWSRATHKVGMDFTTPQGIALVGAYAERIISGMVDGDEFVADDIQGWEYQERAAMHFAWHNCYLRRAKATAFHRQIQLCYAMAENLALVIDSDGYFHCKPFHTMDSGKVTTHLQNSDERGALALMDYCISRRLSYPPSRPVAATNGDDCITAKGPGVPFSTRLGFVHTDIVVCNRSEFYFSSQEFYFDCDEWKRKPDSLAKSMFNMLVSSDPNVIFDILAYISGHEGFGSVVRYLQDKLC